MPDTATGISILALIVSAFALGWNVYRDVVFRARVRVRVAVVQLLSGGSVARKVGERINISVANLGPGPVQIVGINGMIAPWWKRVVRKQQYFVVLQDHTNPMSAQLPKKIDVGDTLDIYLPHEARSFLSSGATHIGVRDSFGRVHFAPRRELERAKEQYAKDFPQSSGTTVAAETPAPGE